MKNLKDVSDTELIILFNVLRIQAEKDKIYEIIKDSNSCDLTKLVGLKRIELWCLNVSELLLQLSQEIKTPAITDLIDLIRAEIDSRQLSIMFPGSLFLPIVKQ